MQTWFKQQEFYDILKTKFARPLLLIESYLSSSIQDHPVSWGITAFGRHFLFTVSLPSFLGCMASVCDFSHFRWWVRYLLSHANAVRPDKNSAIFPKLSLSTLFSSRIASSSFVHWLLWLDFCHLLRCKIHTSVEWRTRQELCDVIKAESERRLLI